MSIRPLGCAIESTRPATDFSATRVQKAICARSCTTRKTLGPRCAISNVRRWKSRNLSPKVPAVFATFLLLFGGLFALVPVVSALRPVPQTDPFYV